MPCSCQVGGQRQHSQRGCLHQPPGCTKTTTGRQTDEHWGFSESLEAQGCYVRCPVGGVWDVLKIHTGRSTGEVQRGRRGREVVVILLTQLTAVAETRSWWHLELNIMCHNSSTSTFPYTLHHSHITSFFGHFFYSNLSILSCLISPPPSLYHCLAVLQLLSLYYSALSLFWKALSFVVIVTHSRDNA